jgi:hypothetical protein
LYQKAAEFNSNELIHTFSSGAKRQASSGRYDLICPEFLEKIALVLEEGVNKYSSDNWTKGIPLSNLHHHAFKHLKAYLAGETDEDHLGHLLANLMFIIHFRARCTCAQTRLKLEEIDRQWREKDSTPAR